MTLSWILAGKFSNSFSADLLSLTVNAIISPFFFCQQDIRPGHGTVLYGVVL